MKTMCYPFMILAGAGFLLSLLAHLVALAGKPLPGIVMLLHVGIFVVWFPAILTVRKSYGKFDPKRHWDVILAPCPKWMRVAIKVIFVYAVVNFLLFMASATGQPKPKGPAPPSVVRGFSGHWMVFYGVAFVVLYSAIKSPISGRGAKDSKRQQ